MSNRNSTTMSTNRYNGATQFNSSNSPQEEINICLEVERTVNLKVKGSETIKGLKALLNGKYGFTENLQELFFNGYKLGDYRRLVDYGVCMDSCLRLVLHNFVYVQLPSKQNPIVVETRDKDTIWNIKAIIQSREGIKPNQFTLVYGGQLLEDYKTLASLHILNESTLYVVSNPKDELSISVKAPRGETIQLKARALFTVNDVKTIIASKFGVSINGQNLIYAGNLLEDHKTLAFYEIVEGSILEMFSVQIFVKAWNGRTVTLNVDQGDTVKVVKKKFSEKIGNPACLLSLVFAGKRLEDHRDLASYNIEQNSTLHAVYSLNSTLQAVCSFHKTFIY